LNRLLLRSNTFIRAARRTVKKYPHSAKDIQATLELLKGKKGDVKGKKGDATLFSNLLSSQALQLTASTPQLSSIVRLKNIFLLTLHTN